MAQCMELTNLEDDHADLVCVICLEPLHEGRRFDCFHLLCSHCALKHVKACLSQSSGVMMPFGPVFCPQCREVTYVYANETEGLPVCRSVVLARQEAQRILVHLTGLDNENEASCKSDENENLRQAAIELDNKLSEATTRVLKLTKEEHELRDRIYSSATEDNLIDSSAISNRLDNVKIQKAVSVLLEEFEEEVTALNDTRANITQEVEGLFFQKWVLQAVRHSKYPGDKVEQEWEEWKNQYPKVMEAKAKTDLECQLDVPPEETFIISALFRLHRPYPGAVLPEHRVKEGQITAELLWQRGQRGKERGEFDWPIHAVFIDNGKRIAVADKNNCRVVIMDPENGEVLEHVLRGQVKPRRVHHYGSNPGVLMISDEIDACIRIVEMDTWQMLGRFGRGLFLCPTGVCERADRSLVYTDMDQGRLTVHSADSFGLENKFTIRMLGDRYVASPSYVTMDADNYFIVSDSQNDCVKIFNERGGIVSRFGDDILRCPRGIGIDPLGLIFVVDSDHHVIRVFDPFGKYMQDLSLPGPPLHYPMSLAYLPEERLLLITQCSFLYHDHCVALYRLEFNDFKKQKSIENSIQI